MMKKKWFRGMVFTFLAMNVFALTGCGENKDDTTADALENSKPAVAYMIGRTANAKPIDASVPLVQDTLVNCAENYGYAFAVRVDGQPELVAAENLDVDEKFKIGSKERLKRDALNKATHMQQILDQVSAVYPEVDYLEGLRCTADALRSLDESYTSRTVICCGTGLGTAGYMNFKNNLLSADPQVIVEMLKEYEALPDLNGITVYWIGMGQVAAPQEKLTPKQSKNLEGIWQAVVEASGGEFITNTFMTVSEEIGGTEALPEVSVVDVPADKPITFEQDALELQESNVFQEPVMLGERQVEFVGDTATYLYPEMAIETIRPIAEYLMENESVTLLLVGATAGDETNDEILRLSQERADAVKDTLMELGIDSSRICTMGMGSDDPWHIHNAGYDGEAASSNRKVVLIDRRTELAQELMNTY